MATAPSRAFTFRCLGRQIEEVTLGELNFTLSAEQRTYAIRPVSQHSLPHRLEQDEIDASLMLKKCKPFDVLIEGLVSEKVEAREHE